MSYGKLGLLALCAATLALTGCKTDSEDDLPGWGNPDGGDQPAATGQVVLNEICGKQDPDDDWVELYNKSTQPADLSGMRLIKTDENGKDETLYTFAQGATLEAGAYRVVATLSGELQAGISNSKEVAITLQAADGTTLDHFDRDSDVGKDQSHATGGSYARMPDGTGAWTITTACTRGTQNATTDTPTGRIVLNEICGKQNPDDDWVELYNTGSEPIDLSGASLIKTDEDGLDETLYTFTPGYVVAGGDYAVIATLSGELQAGISNSKEVGIRLQLADGTVLDRFDRDSDVGKNQSHATGGSYARVPNGTGSWTIVTTCTRGAKNQ